MIIVYESKTGFTKKYANMLAAKAHLIAIPVQECSKIQKDEEIIFWGWMKAGKIQGLNKVRKYNVVAVCGSGTARRAEPDTETLIARNQIEGIPFFYLRGGCFPLKELKGMDKVMLTLFLSMLKKRKNINEELKEAIWNMENGFDGVKEANLESVIDWLRINRDGSF